MTSPLTDDIIDGLDDLDDAVALLNTLGIDSDEIEDVGDAKHELRKYLAKAKKLQESETPGLTDQAYQITAENVSYIFSCII